MDHYSPGPLAQAPGPGSTAEENRPGLFQVLWRRKGLVLVPVIVLVALALVYLVTEPRRYSNAARLQVTPAPSRLGADSLDSGQLGNFLNTQAEKILSREVLALTLTQTIPDDSGLPGMSGKQIRDLKTFQPLNSDYSPLTTLQNLSDVTVGRKDDTLTVRYETPFKEESAVITNAIVDAFIKYQTQPKASKVLGALDAYRAQKAKIDGELGLITDKMSALEQKYGVLSNNGEDNLAFRQLAMISQLRAAAHAEVLKAKGDFDEAARLTARDPRILTTPTAGPDSIVSADDEQMLRATLTQLQAKLRDMRVNYLPGHPAVRALQQKVDQASAGYAEAVKRRWLRAQAAEEDLNAQFDQQNRRAVEASAQAAHYGHLKDDSDRLRRELESIETRINGVEVQQSAGPIEIDFFERADPTRPRKSHPSESKTLGLALVLGLLLGCGLALVRDRLDDRVHSSEEIKSALGVSLLGAIPQMPAGISPSDAGQRVVFEPDSEVAEAFRSVRTAIAFGAPKDRSKTLLITSPTAGDGKSTAAANLAIVTAQAGKKVLLIDADLRNPRLNTIFGLVGVRVGLSSLLDGQGTWEQAIQHSATGGLDLLPCGPRPRNPSEMLNSPMFSELLEMLTEKYDQVIIDSPPVLGLADARIIAASCDLTVLVLRSGKSTRKLSVLAREGLAGVGAHVLGVLVNDVARRDEYSFEGTYGYPHAPHTPSPATAATNTSNDVALRANVLARRTKDD